ncbi:hypothetical protein CRYUN_Cryun19dG0074000 [Craigia yunnanensis]
MWKGGSENSDSYWDNIPQNLYNMFFHEADNIQQIYRDKGLPVLEYQKHYNSYSYGDNYGRSTYLGEYSGYTSDEALARHLLEMEDGFQNFSFDEPVRTGAGVSEGGSSFSGEDDEVQDDSNLDEMTYEVGILFESAVN